MLVLVRSYAASAPLLIVILRETVVVLVRLHGHRVLKLAVPDRIVDFPGIIVDDVVRRRRGYGLGACFILPLLHSAL